MNWLEGTKTSTKHYSTKRSELSGFSGFGVKGIQGSIN